jgi:hypothetical protein
MVDYNPFPVAKYLGHSELRQYKSGMAIGEFIKMR